MRGRFFTCYSFAISIDNNNILHLMMGKVDFFNFVMCIKMTERREIRPRRIMRSERARRGKVRKGEIGAYKKIVIPETTVSELDPTINFLDNLIFYHPERKSTQTELSQSIRQTNADNKGQELKWINITKDTNKESYASILQIYENNQEMIAYFYNHEYATATVEGKERALTCLNQLENWFCSIEEPREPQDSEWSRREIERCSGISYHCRPALREYITPIVTAEMKARLKHLL